ncbi:glycosyltransferase [Cellulosimicrobium sp. PMB13]|uniref:glycosyltransferase n=1 Tax=Cellulosimicrobium sp. PMB13 TaxID=3120158 RepID=UPI003F4B1AD5
MTPTRPRTWRRSAHAAPHLDPDIIAAWSRRVPILAAALDTAAEVPEASPAAVREAVGRIVEMTDPSQVWLALAVLSATLPDDTTVVETARASESDPSALVRRLAQLTTTESARRHVRVESQRTVVDVAHTASTTLMTGIQRVARESTRRWLTHDVVLVSWSADLDAVRELTPAEHDRIVRAAAATEDDHPDTELTFVVPWRTTYVLPELAIDQARTERLRTLARFSGGEFTAIGFDLIPLTTGETTAPGMPGAFAGAMTVLRHGARVAPISRAAAVEYAGWRTMLAAAGHDGPAIEPVPLPAEAPPSTESDLADASERFVVGTLPLVLVVGSHEPRKNHRAVLHAAEVLWREGNEFSLTFIGGNAWRSEDFTQRLRRLQEQGLPVESASRIPDRLLWAAYRLARFTVFPSLNEGYGLPVAESLAVGTPAVTSAFGSMAEIADGGGALLVDPRDDVSLRDGMRALLADDATLLRLRAEAAARPIRTWDEYAEDVWRFLVEGAPPAR